MAIAAIGKVDTKTAPINAACARHVSSRALAPPAFADRQFDA
jgi:hypothetical protein